MDEIVNMPSKERLRMFQDASASLNIPIPMIEKDFWIYWILSKLFGDRYFAQQDLYLLYIIYYIIFII